MGQYDTTIKELAKTRLPELIGWLRPQVRDVSIIEMPQELPATLRHVDVLVKVLDARSGPELVLLESQAQRDIRLHASMLLRAGLAHNYYGLPVRSVLLALTPSAVMEEAHPFARYRDEVVHHKVEVRRLYEESAEAALQTGPQVVLPLVPAMRPRDGDYERVLAQVIERLAGSEDPVERKKLLIGWASTFATLHLSQVQVEIIVGKAIRRTSFMLNPLQDLPLLRDTYQQGIEKGIGKGKTAMLIRFYEARLGPMPPSLRDALALVKDDAQLDALVTPFVSGTQAEIEAYLRQR